MMRTTITSGLSRGDIHIWTLPAKAPDDLLARFSQVLNADETDQAVRFRFRNLRDSFVTAHGVLRYLLGRYLHLDPAKIQFSFGSRGKPSVTAADGIRFNMTHSGSVTVIALAMECELGVDVEEIRPLSDAQHIADRFFCDEEAAELMAVPGTMRERAFFCCWTRKEAYVKATGAGLSGSLNRFRVTVHPETLPRFIHIDHNTAAANTWILRDLNLASGYTAALAYRAPEHRLSFFPVVDLRQMLELK